jgi:hypothetical protein
MVRLTLEEEQGAQRLVLDGTGDVALNGQRGQEPRHLGPTHLKGVALAMEENEPADPRDVGDSAERGPCPWARDPICS